MWRPYFRLYQALAALPGGLALSLAAPAFAEPAPAQPAPTIDYGASASWLCRPGAETVCTADLDALAIGPDGTRTPQGFAAAADPAIDCFYVYPTVSHETTPYADMTASPEIVRTARAQAGRLASRCRLFVPLYRQLTVAGLDQSLGGGGTFDWSQPYVDVLAAWRWYLAHDNKGRGVVLIGHSQGTILLQRLIAEEIDGKPAQARLVAAFLAGDPGLPVPAGAVVGGVFKHVPLCTSAAQTGCAYAWGSFAVDDASATRYFGRSPGGGLIGGCVDPAAPGGGKGLLKAYLPKPAMAPANDPPWIEVVGQLSASCVADAQGNVLRVTVEPTSFADLLHGVLTRVAARPGWGLHALDLSLPQGNILDDIDAETAAWKTH